jgi:hypothetical protein
VPEIGEVEPFGRFQARVGRQRVVEVEGEIAPALHQERRHPDRAEELASRSLVGERVERGEILARDRVVHDRVQAGRRACLDRLPEAEQDARAGEILWQERGVEVGPRDRRLDRRERDAFARRAPDGTAAVRVAERADPSAVDGRLLSEPAEELAHVLDFARPVDRDEALRLPVSRASNVSAA